MTDKLLIEALEETRDTLVKVLIKIRRDAPDLSGKLLGHADQVIARVDTLLDAQAHRSQQEAAQEPVGQLVTLVSAVNALNYLSLHNGPGRLMQATQMLVWTTSPAPSEALRPLPYGPNDIQWLKAIHGALPKLLKVAEVEQQGADFVTVLGDLIARLETERAERAALSASGQKGEPT